MEPTGARTFDAGGDAYDVFMGRYSQPLAHRFVDVVGVAPGHRALDVGCGPGALTGALVERLGATAVAGCDPSPPFVAACTARFPGVDVRPGRAEELPFEDAGFDVALAQLVLHFVADPGRAAAELRRVLRPGGVAAASVWDFAEGMEMLRLFWDAALAVSPEAPDEARTLRFGREHEIADLLADNGFVDVAEGTLTVTSTYADVDELWSGLLQGIGPAGAWLVAQDADRRAAVRAELEDRLGRPTGSFTLSALARYATGRAPA